jgi:hypothetical protein
MMSHHAIKNKSVFGEMPSIEKDKQTTNDLAVMAQPRPLQEFLTMISATYMCAPWLRFIFGFSKRVLFCIMTLWIMPGSRILANA